MTGTHPRRYRLHLEGLPVEATCRRSRGARMIADRDGSLRLSVPSWFSERDCQAFVEAHRIHPDHSRAFYELLDGVCPDWRDARRRLDTEGIRLA